MEMIKQRGHFKGSGIKKRVVKKEKPVFTVIDPESLGWGFRYYWLFYIVYACHKIILYKNIFYRDDMIWLYCMNFWSFLVLFIKLRNDKFWKLKNDHFYWNL